MPEARGRLPKGETAQLALGGDSLEVSVQKGFIGKKLVPTLKLGLDQVVEAQVSKGHEPYTGSHRLQVRYTVDGEERELLFFTIHEDKVTEIQKKVVEFVAGRRELLERQRSEFEETRRLHLTQLYHSLELVDRLFEFVTLLGGEVDWPGLRETMDQLKLIQRDRETLESRQFSLSLDRLEAEMRMRHVGEIKTEVKAILETVLLGVSEASRHPNEWFNTRYHHLFVSTLYLLWQRELAGATGMEATVDAERLGQQADVLVSLVDAEYPRERAVGSEGFSRATLYYLVDRLTEVPFEPHL